MASIRLYPTLGDHSWKTSTDNGKVSLVFNLNGTYSLDSLHIWNLNFVYDNTEFTMREAQTVDIYTSVGGNRNEKEEGRREEE
jgi:hypothetical protein